MKVREALAADIPALTTLRMALFCEVVACATLALFVRPPYPGNLAGREGYLLNIYTRPAWRRRGMANALLVAMVAYAREQQLGKLWLHASSDGRAIYERFGFAGNPACLECVPGR